MFFLRFYVANIQHFEMLMWLFVRVSWKKIIENTNACLTICGTSIFEELHDFVRTLDIVSVHSQYDCFFFCFYFLNHKIQRSEICSSIANFENLSTKYFIFTFILIPKRVRIANPMPVGVWMCVDDTIV